MTDEDIYHIIRPALMKFVIYRNLKIAGVINWQTNTPESKANIDIEIIDYADTVGQAVSIVNALKKQAK